MLTAVGLFAWCVLLCLLERWRPRRLQPFNLARICANIALGLFNTFMSRVLVPVSLIAWSLALQTSESSWLDLSALVGPFWQVLIGFLILDLALYWQHRLSHRWDWLWRLHRAHHLDPQVDVTTALRFHPLEILVSLAWKALVVWIFGLTAVTVLCFELVLAAAAMFNHANISLSHKVDGVLQWLLVTPDMHRIHHSVAIPDQQRNFSTSLSCWDRLFGSFAAQPANAEEEFKLGLGLPISVTESASWRRLLLSPFE